MRKVILFVIILCMTASAYAGVEMTKQGVKFFYEAPNAGQVSVAGEFNDWNTSAHIMKMNDDGVWEIVIPLDNGAYMYKFVVDGNWYADPDNPKQLDDGYGSFNSVIKVTSDLESEEFEEIETIGHTTLDLTKPPPVSHEGKTPKFEIPSTTSETNIMVISPYGKEMKKGVSFMYEAPNAGQVSVAGDFNDWDTSKHIMSKNRDGIWDLAVPLESGTYMYKFVVDGNWVADPGNPNQSDDGFGGVNSVIEVGSSGDLKVQKVVEQKQTGVRTFMNPKVLFDGRVYSKNIFEKEEYNDKLMLDKPLYDMNLGMKIKFNSQVEGYTVLNINNIAEGVDMWKTHLNFKRSYLKLDAPHFLVQAFDKYGFLTFDDPLHLVGALGFRDYNFGYDVMGVYGKSKVPTVMLPLAKIPFTFNFETVFGDNVGDNDMDVKAGRASGDFHVIPEIASIILGYGAFHAQLPVSSTSSQEHVSSEVDLQLNYSFDQPGWMAPLNIALMGEYYQFKDTDNTSMDSVKTEFANGDRMYAGLNIDFPTALGVFAHYQRNKISLQKDVTKNIFTIGSTFETKTLTAKPVSYTHLRAHET